MASKGKVLDDFMNKCVDLSQPAKASGFHKPAVSSIKPKQKQQISFDQSTKARQWTGQVDDFRDLFIVASSPAASSLPRPEIYGLQQYPNWFLGQLPPIYGQIRQSCTRDGHISTELLQPLLLSTGIPKDSLATLWSVINKTIPGELTAFELNLLLCFIGFLQAGVPFHNLPFSFQSSVHPVIPFLTFDNSKPPPPPSLGQQAPVNNTTQIVPTLGLQPKPNQPQTPVPNLEQLSSSQIPVQITPTPTPSVTVPLAAAVVDDFGDFQSVNTVPSAPSYTSYTCNAAGSISEQQQRQNQRTHSATPILPPSYEQSLIAPSGHVNAPTAIDYTSAPSTTGSNLAQPANGKLSGDFDDEFGSFHTFDPPVPLVEKKPSNVFLPPSAFSDQTRKPLSEVKADFGTVNPGLTLTQNGKPGEKQKGSGPLLMDDDKYSALRLFDSSTSVSNVFAASENKHEEIEPPRPSGKNQQSEKDVAMETKDTGHGLVLLVDTSKHDSSGFTPEVTGDIYPRNRGFSTGSEKFADFSSFETSVVTNTTDAIITSVQKTSIFEGSTQSSSDKFEALKNLVNQSRFESVPVNELSTVDEESDWGDFSFGSSSNVQTASFPISASSQGVEENKKSPGFQPHFDHHTQKPDVSHTGLLTTPKTKTVAEMGAVDFSSNEPPPLDLDNFDDEFSSFASGHIPDSPDVGTRKPNTGGHSMVASGNTQSQHSTFTILPDIDEDGFFAPPPLPGDSPISARSSGRLSAGGAGLATEAFAFTTTSVEAGPSSSHPFPTPDSESTHIPPPLVEDDQPVTSQPSSTSQGSDLKMHAAFANVFVSERKEDCDSIASLDLPPITSQSGGASLDSHSSNSAGSGVGIPDTSLSADTPDVGLSGNQSALSLDHSLSSSGGAILPDRYKALSEASVSSKGQSDLNGPDSEHIHHWRQCLTACKNLLDQACELFSSADQSVLNEVLHSVKGRNYVNGIWEIYLVIVKIETSMKAYGISTEDLSALAKSIQSSWADIVDDIKLHSPVEIDESMTDFRSNLIDRSELSPVYCSICLLSTLNSGHLDYAGRYYHSTCANFFVNCVNSLLPCLDIPDVI